MLEEEIVGLLREIRNLQRQHVENYKDALSKQQEAIDLQKSATRRQRVSLWVLLAFLIALLFLAYYPFKH